MDADEQNRLWLAAEQELAIANSHIRALVAALENEDHEQECGPCLLESSVRALNGARGYLGMKPWGSA